MGSALSHPLKESLPLAQRLPQWWSEVHERPSTWEDVERPRRIGYGFENIIIRFVETAPKLELLKARWPIYEAKRTIGEIDLLVKTPDGIEHWELGLKFYLYVPELNYFIGANAADRLDLKLNKLRDRQLPHGRHPQVLQWCERSGIEAPRSYALIKGRMFLPDGTSLDEVCDQHELNPEGDWGRWRFNSSFRDTIRLGSKALPLSRYQWCSRQHHKDLHEFWSCPDTLGSCQWSIMSPSPSVWMEKERCYVVADDFVEKCRERFC